MSSYKLRKSVELDPEWFLEGGPVPLRQAGMKRVRRVQLSPKGKQTRSKEDGGSHRNYVRKVLREMGYTVV